MKIINDDNFPKRRSIRLPDYDYTLPGPYFITICTQYKKQLFGRISNGRMILNSAGTMIQECWDAMPEIYNGILLNANIVMPDHFHGILYLNIDADFNILPVRDISLMDTVQRFKSITTTKYREGVKRENWPRFENRLWQRSFYEEILTSEKKLLEKEEYIENNPLMAWLRRKSEKQMKDLQIKQ